MELKELANKIGVKRIIISHYNNDYYKDEATIIFNDFLALNQVGKRYNFIPLTAEGINKEINKKQIENILNLIKKEMTNKTI